jgi:hypothetical protein
MAAIAVGWQAGQQMEADDAPKDETPHSSSVCAGLTIGEACAHYTDIPREEEGAKFRQTLADQAYNLDLLEEHRRAEEQLAVGTTIVPDVDVAEQ